ncbi:hypothetical protein [Flaviaesturariibacter terrae]
MKKILLAGILLTTGFTGSTELFAHATTVATINVPPNVRDAYAALQAQYAANGQILVNAVWTRANGVFTVTFLIVDLSVEDSYTPGSASFHGGGQPVN